LRRDTRPDAAIGSITIILAFVYQLDKFFQRLIDITQCYDDPHFCREQPDHPQTRPLAARLSMAKKQLIDAYFRFLNLAQAVQALPSVPKLDAAEERLLEALAAAWHAGKTLTVTETMALSAAGAPATVHRRLAKLKEQGLVTLDEAQADARTKTVVPTQKALAYFEQLAACLEEAKKKK
jgi:hypothetical protein